MLPHLKLMIELKHGFFKNAIFPSIKMWLEYLQFLKQNSFHWNILKIFYFEKNWTKKLVQKYNQKSEAKLMPIFSFGSQTRIEIKGKI